MREIIKATVETINNQNHEFGKGWDMEESKGFIIFFNKEKKKEVSFNFEHIIYVHIEYENV